MEKWHQLGQPAVRFDQPGCHFLWMRGGVADALNARDVVDIFQQHGKVGDLARVTHGSKVGIDVLSEQCDFFDPLVGEVSDLGQDILKGSRNLLTSCVGHHAKAAILAAAFHDGDKSSRSLHAWGRHVVELFDFRKADVDL